MKLQRKLRSLVLKMLLASSTLQATRWWFEVRRKFAGRRHTVSVFLQLDDPYSYVLSCYLPEFAEHYDIQLNVYLSEAKAGAFQPSSEMLAEYAVTDGRRLAQELGIPFLDKGKFPPSDLRKPLLEAIARSAQTDSYLDEVLAALAAYWRGDSAAAQRMCSSPDGSDGASEFIALSLQKLDKLGHYNSAMLHYAGEWYWGVDRLHYLMQRLDEVGAAREIPRSARLTSIRQAMHVTLPVKPPTSARDLPAVELFYSPRSPYSYLLLARLYAIVDAFGLDLQLRPVLPMVMRGMQVPRQKLLYIARDAMREARRMNIPFGDLADPVGIGVERFLAVFDYANSERRGRDFLLNGGVATWAEAIDMATDKGMRKVTGRTGLFWPEAKAAMQNDDWREAADTNRAAMMEAGCWGVPTVRMGDYVAWGQDRDWMLVRHIEELCDAGEGILV
ncbi:MAG: DsbA family protein [Gammaproteobacteria bacterium]|nr:DsbA family protein [Gammaproteobacteria bacterium]